MRFTVEVAEDDVISKIESAVVDGRLGDLSVNSSSIIGIPPVIQTTTTPSSENTPKPDSMYHFFVVP